MSITVSRLFPAVKCFCVTIIVLGVGCFEGEMYKSATRAEQQQATQQIAPAQTSLPSVQRNGQEVKAANAGHGTDSPQQITIVDARSNVLGWVVAIINFLLLVAVWYQARANKAAVGVMQTQERDYARQANTMDESLTETRNLVKQNADMVTAMQGQLDAMERQFIHSERAYVGIHRIERRIETKTPFIQIENTGRIPGDKIIARIFVILLVPDYIVERHAGAVKPVSESEEVFEVNYGRTQLHRGALHLQATPELRRWLTEFEIELAFRGDARIVLHVRLDYWDGFAPAVSDFAFHFDARANEWKPWPVWTADDLSARKAEELQRYQPIKPKT